MKTVTPHSYTRVLIFFSVLVCIMFVTNLVVYQALIGVLGLALVGERLLLGVVLGGLAGGFILASMLGMRFYNAFTRGFYYITAVWMGLLVYLFLASVSYGFLLLLDVKWATSIGQILIAGAVVVAGYGVLHARKITVTPVDVTLPGLPLAWKGKKAIWISDLHLGQVYGPESARALVERLNALQHDIIFIGGDMYDGTGAPDIIELAAPFRKLLAPLGTYFITGNHEEIGDSQAFVAAVEAAGIRTLLNEVIEIDGLQIVGIDYRSAKDRTSYQAILKGLLIDPQKPSVLLKHEPKDVDVTRDAGVSFQLSGHTHKAQLWPLSYIAHSVYKGFSYGLKSLGSLQVYTSSGVGSWGPPMRVGTNREIVHITFR